MTLEKYPEQRKTERQKIFFLFNGTNTADTNLIACKAIIGHNYASDISGACSRLSHQVPRFHGGSHMEAKRYKHGISEVSSSGGRVHGNWIHDGCAGGGRGGQDGRDRRGGRRTQTMTNRVEVSDPDHNFTACEWNILRWNGGQAYVAQAQEHMNGRGYGG